MKRRRAVALALLAACAGWGPAQTARAAPPLKLGLSAALTGPLSAHGKELARGVRMSIEQANAVGGVGGQAIELQVMDDGGQAQRAVSNARALIEAGALALTGFAVGAELVLPVLEQSGTPLVGAASGAEALREPLRPLLFNLRAGLRDEAAAMVVHLDSASLTDVGVVSQDDDFGRTAREGLRVELARYYTRPLSSADVTLSSGDAGIAAAVDAVCRERPQVLLLLLDAERAPAALRRARKTGCGRHFYLINEAGTALQAGAVPSNELAGVVVSQIVPHPANVAVPLVAEYRRQAVQTGVAPGYASLEGYLYGKVLVETLTRCGREPTRRCIVTALESRPLDLGGFRVQFSRSNRRGSSFVEMTFVTSDGRFRR